MMKKLLIALMVMMAVTSCNTFKINVKLASDGTGIVVTRVDGAYPVKNFS